MPVTEAGFTEPATPVSEALLTGLPPHIHADTRVLLLGSFPGVASLTQSRYYAHPTNQFWRLLGACLDDADLPALAYEARLQRLREHRVGLWDVVAQCRRQGSLDTAITDAAVNPLAGWLHDQAPALQRIGFNGGLSWKHGHHLGDHGYAVFKLPSSSAAAASMRFEQKLAIWRTLFEGLSG